MGITVRYRIREMGSACSTFSASSYRTLSSGSITAPDLPSGFTDTPLPIIGATLAETIYLSGLFSPPPLCSGIGKCGHCRVRFISPPPPALEVEKKVLSHHAIDSGWRLACRHTPEDGTHVLIPALPLENSPAHIAAIPTGHRVSFAVDLGTTTIHWQAVNRGKPGGSSLPHGAMTNPQMGAGSDVVSRLAYAATPEGADILRRLTVEALARVVRSAEDTGLSVEELCIAANPAMTAILLGLDTSGLAHAPYTLPFTGGTVNVPGLPPVYIPPLISPYVGADASAGYAALALDPTGPLPEFPFLIVDLGTSGECVLAVSETKAFAASLPMGPALEGVNLSCGMAMGHGAILEYTLTPHGLVPIVEGDTAPLGITATGYLTLLRSLRAANIVTEEGAFAPQKNALPLARRISGKQEGTAMEEPRIRLPGKMFLTASDVEEILKVKAAFTLAVTHLLREAGLPITALKRIFLSGSLGSRAPVAALTTLGFFPAVVESKVTAAGNTALQGALLFLNQSEIRGKCEEWAKTVTTVDLVGSLSFGNNFARHMIFSWVYDR